MYIRADMPWNVHHNPKTCTVCQYMFDCIEHSKERAAVDAIMGRRRFCWRAHVRVPHGLRCAQRLCFSYGIHLVEVRKPYQRRVVGRICSIDDGNRKQASTEQHRNDEASNEQQQQSRISLCVAQQLIGVWFKMDFVLSLGIKMH